MSRFQELHPPRQPGRARRRRHHGHGVRRCRHRLHRHAALGDQQGHRRQGAELRQLRPRRRARRPVPHRADRLPDPGGGRLLLRGRALHQGQGPLLPRRGDRHARRRRAARGDPRPAQGPRRHTSDPHHPRTHERPVPSGRAVRHRSARAAPRTCGGCRPSNRRFVGQDRPHVRRMRTPRRGAQPWCGGTSSRYQSSPLPEVSSRGVAVVAGLLRYAVAEDRGQAAAALPGSGSCSGAGRSVPSASLTHRPRDGLRLRGRRRGRGLGLAGRRGLGRGLRSRGSPSASSEGVPVPLADGVPVAEGDGDSVAADDVLGGSAVTAFPDSRRAGISLSSLISFQISVACRSRRPCR